MKYAYFPGCVISQRENPFELSARKVISKLGIELVDLEGSSCCGFLLGAVDHLSSTVMAARNLALAEEKGYDILTLCPACSNHFIRVKTELQKDSKLLNAVNKALGEVNRRYKGSSEVKHITRILTEDVGVEKIKETVTNPLKQLRVAPHWGCHVVKPSEEILFDSPENTKLLNTLIESTGAETVNYLEKNTCCGAPIMGVDEKLAIRIVREKLNSMEENHADLIITVCPFCHIHYDLFRGRIEEQYSEKYEIPVLHYTQLLGLAQGLDPDELGLYENRVPVDDILEKI